MAISLNFQRLNRKLLAYVVLAVKHLVVLFALEEAQVQAASGLPELLVAHLYADYMRVLLASTHVLVDTFVPFIVAFDRSF